MKGHAGKLVSLYVLLAAAGMSATLVSCSPAFYSTVGQNVPLFHEKGEVALSGGIMSASNTVEGFNPFTSLSTGMALQAAVSIDSGAALLASYYDINYDGDWQISARYAEFGGGLFKYYSESGFVGELFVGLGYGKLGNRSDQEVINAEFIKYLVQPSGGFSGKIFDVAFTPRMGIVDYLSHSHSPTPGVQEFFDEQKTTFVFEPGITARVGYKNFKAQYQMNYTSFRFSSVYRTEEFDPVMNCYGSLSLFIRITHRWTH